MAAAPDEDWRDELASVDADLASDNYAVGYGASGGVRIDAVGVDLEGIVQEHVRNYNESADPDEQVNYRRTGPLNEVVVPEKLDRAVDGVPDDVEVTTEDDDAFHEFTALASDDEEFGGERSYSFSHTADAIVERYFAFDELPETVEDQVYTDIHGRLLQGKPLFVDDRDEDVNELQELARDEALQYDLDHEEGVTLVYREA
ncbi:MAG: hypothetical protein SV186_01730 [Candidatus Nanohaloarchaea archaeon]|nr:hypothetical protein [Candidatus Nanohaloarchaea archaeon]